jgi:hypothetical protein
VNDYKYINCQWLDATLKDFDNGLFHVLQPKLSVYLSFLQRVLKPRQFIHLDLIVMTQFDGKVQNLKPLNFFHSFFPPSRGGLHRLGPGSTDNVRVRFKWQQSNVLSGFLGQFFLAKKNWVTTADTDESSESVESVLLNNLSKDYWQLYIKRNTYSWRDRAECKQIGFYLGWNKRKWGFCRVRARCGSAQMVVGPGRVMLYSLCPNILHSTSFPNTWRQCSSRGKRDQLPHPNKTMDKTVVALYTFSI